MIPSFRLPDLVLGVALKADVSGSRQAAQDLKRSIQKEMGVVSGGGGGGRGGGVGGSLLAGAAAVSAVSAAANKVAKTAKLRDDIWKKIIDDAKPAFRGPLRGGQAFNNVFARDWKGPAGTRFGDWRNSFGAIQWRAKQAQVAAELNTLGRKPATDISRMVATSKAASSATAATAAAAGIKAATRSGNWWATLGASFAQGNITRGIAMAAKRFWPLLIVLLAWEFIKHVMIPAIKAAVGYIKRSGAGGTLGEFGKRAGETPVLLKNVAVQFGLMWIELLNLLPVLEDFNAILIRVASLVNYVREQKWLSAASRMSMSLNPYVMWFKGLNWLIQKIPLGSGGADLGAGRSPKLAGAYLEGSVEAYSNIRGTMQRYAADTARNTKETSDTLKKILARAPEMGVVAG